MGYLRASLLVLAVLGLGAGRLVAGPLCASMNGDNNADGGIDLSDAVYILAHLFQGGPVPENFCFAVGSKEPDCARMNGDVNGDGARDLSDPIYSLAWSFKDGPDPLPPCPDVGGPEVCNDLFDNDGDGDTDCADPDCIGDPNCIESVCDPTDLVDDDGDGFTDCDDPDCFTETVCTEECPVNFNDLTLADCPPFPGELFDCWCVTDELGGQPEETFVQADNVGKFIKEGTAPSSTRGVTLPHKRSRRHVPWSVEVTFPFVSQFPEGGGRVAFRFFSLQSVMHERIEVRNVNGDLLVNTVAKVDDSPVWDGLVFDPNTITSLTLKMDAAVSGLTVSAATDGGAFGAGQFVPWVNEEGIITLDDIDLFPDVELTMLSFVLDSRDLRNPGAEPFEVWIDDLKLTSVKSVRNQNQPH